MANIGTIISQKGEQFTNAHVASMSRKDAGFYVLSGVDCHQAASPGLSVVVDVGVVVAGYGLAQKTVAGGTLTVTTPDATLPRIDVVYIDSNGTAGLYAGTPTAINPPSKTDFKQMAAPAPGSNIPTGVILALVYVAAGATSILNASINDIASYGAFNTEAPSGTTTSGYVPQWSATQKTLTTGLAVGTSANNLLQLDAFAKMPVTTIANGTLGQTIIQGASNPGWVTRTFDVAFPFGDGSNVLVAGSCEFRIPIACTIIAARVWEVGVITSSITCTLYKHALGAAKGSLVDTFAIATNVYYEETGLSIAVTTGDILRIDTSGITSAKQIVCSLTCNGV